MRNRKLISICISLILCAGLTACGDSVSREEFEALEQRVSALEGNSAGSTDDNNNGIVIDNDTEEWKTTEVSEGVPDSNQCDEFTVRITPENLSTYISLFSYVRDKDNGQGSEIAFRHKSNIYDSGWVYADCSSDYSIVYSIDTINNSDYAKKYNITYDLDFDKPFDAVRYDNGEEMGHDYPKEISVDDVSLKNCSGKLKFISIRHVEKDEVDDMKYFRNVQFSNRERQSYSLDKETLDLKF